MIRSCGFYNTKSKDLVECAKILLEQHGGKVPGTMEELTALPGIGRKTANLILGDIYGQPAYVCDTHCIRITGRFGLTDGSKDPLSVEKQLRVRSSRRRNRATSAIAWCSSGATSAPRARQTATAARSERTAITARRRNRQKISKPHVVRAMRGLFFFQLLNSLGRMYFVVLVA